MTKFKLEGNLKSFQCSSKIYTEIETMTKPQKSLTIYLGLCLAWIMLLGACSSFDVAYTPEPSPTATQTLEPTATIDWFPRTATPSPTPFYTPTAVALQPDRPEGIGEVIIRDDFSDTSLWSTGSSPAGNIVYGDKSLSLAVAGNKSTLTSTSQHSLPSNFFLEVNVNVALCTPGDQYSLLFWWTPEGAAHKLLLSCEGSLRMERLTGNGGQVLQDWDVASRMMPGSPATHKVGILARGGEVSIYVNDRYQFQVRTQPDYIGGLGVQARAGGDTAVTIAFSNMVVYEIEPAR